MRIRQLKPSRYNYSKHPLYTSGKREQIFLQSQNILRSVKMFRVKVIIVQFVVLVSIIFQSFVHVGADGGMFDKIKTGLRYATDYLEIVKDVTNLVSQSLNTDKKGSTKRGDPEEGVEPEKNQEFGPTNLISAFFRLFGLDSQKIAAIAVNSVIFLAKMISSLFDLPPVKTDKIDRSVEFDANESPWDPLKFILENKNDKMIKLLEEARNEALPDKLIDTIDGFDSACIRLLLCKTSIVIRSVQESLKNNKNSRNGMGSSTFTAWLPSKEDFERNSDECEDKYTDCRLFPES